jgi:hypothetical protein
MKALSIRQPWAKLIVEGKKTLELRSWTVNYRGPLAIHASQTVEREACVANGLHPDSVTTGAIVGVVDLIDIVELDEAAYIAHRVDHFAPDRFEPPLYGWQLRNAHALPQPRPMRGRMGLFTVADEWLSATVDHAPEPEPAPPAFEPTWNADKPFELRVTPATERANHTAYNLALYQRLVEPPAAQRTLYREAPPEMQKVVEVGGSALRAVSDQVLDALKRSGYRATDLSANRREPFALSEESGVRLGLLFLAIKPITKMTRVEAISHGLRAMTSEEAYYWYSKCTTGPTADRAQKALRVLLAGE